MVVSRSPFSKKPTTPKGVGEPIKDNPWLSQVQTNPVVQKGDGTKSTVAEEGYKLDKSYQTALGKILSSGMSEKEKKKQLGRLDATYKAGAAGASPGFWEDIGKGLGDIATSTAKAANVLFGPGQAIARGVQSVGQEFGELAEYVRTGGKQGSLTSWGELKSQALDKDFRAIEFGNKYVDNVIDFVLDVGLDPTTYLGVGAVNYAGKTGRAALTTRFATKEMREKYPQIVLNDVMRYGAGAIPKEVLKQEGIEYGLKFAGKKITGTEEVARIISGKNGVLSNLRAKTGDVVEKSAALKAARGFVTPESRAGLQKIGAGRAGVYAPDDKQIIKQVADYSAAKFAKGEIGKFNDDALFKANGIIQSIVDGRLDRAAVTRAVEDPLYRDMAPEAVRQAAEQVANWKDELRNGVNAVYRKFNVDYNGSINDIGFVDDYVHHRLTTEGLQAVKDDAKKTRGWFRSNDLSPYELAKTTGAAVYRKYRAGEDFMGEVLNTGSVDEINSIFARKIGKPGAKFFEDDIVSIMESYAYSMSKARGREAYIRRAMDFGDDIIKVVNQKTVPDRELVASLQVAHKALLAARASLAKEVIGLRGKSVSKAEDVVAVVQKILDSRSGEMAKLGRRVDAATQALAEAEMALIDAMGKAATRNAEQRGVFLEAHKALLEDIQTLKRAIETDTVTEAVAKEEIKKVYRQVFPNAKRIPDNPTKALNAIKRAKGISEPEELRELMKRRDVLGRQIEELTASGDDPQFLNDLLDQEARLSDDITAFEAIGDARMAADYSEDGLLYGRWDDLSERVYNPEVDPRPYRTLDTRPVVRSATELTTDEIAGFRRAWKDDEASVVAHALGPDEIIDLREPENWYGFFDNNGPLGDMVSRALMVGGADPTIFNGAWRDVIEGGVIDPMLADVYPEVAELIDRIGLTGAKVFEDGVVDDDFAVRVFDSIQDSFVDIARANGAENANETGQVMFDTFIRGMVIDSGNDLPVLFPSRAIYGADNNMADGAYSVVLPDSYGYTKGYNPGDILDNPGAPVRFAKDDELVTQIMDGSLEQASWDAFQQMDAVTQEAAEVQARSAAVEALRDEVKTIGQKIGGTKGAASRRIKAVQKSFDSYAKTGKFKAKVDGKTVELTREQALDVLGRKEKKINDEILKLEDRLAEKTGRDTASIQARIRDRQARLAALMDQKKVLERWDDKTGQALREDVDLLREAIAFEPPRGYAGIQSRQWSERVRRRMDNLAKMAGDTRPEIKAYDRVVTQMHNAEANLAWMDMFDIPASDARLQAARAGTYAPKVIDDIEKGWKVLESLGVQVPPDFYDIATASLRPLKDPKEFSKFWDSVDYVNAVFKTYATLTPGFSVRNAISAVFMNTVAGVTSGNMAMGARAVKAYLKHGPMRIVDGQSVGWLKELGVPEESWQMYETAFRAVKATSRGQSVELAGPAVRGKMSELVLNNAATRLGRRANDAVEMMVRLPMALDTLQRGFGYDEAVARITKYHFDYDDISKLDEKAKRLIPFWIWTTRNIPLQMTEQLLRPGTYRAYQELTDRNEVGSEVIMPRWLSEMNPIALNDSWVLAPDLPQVRLGQQAQQFADPKRLVGQMYPLPKLLIELGIADKQLSMDIPFSDKYEKARGIDSLIAGLGEITNKDWLGRRDPETGELTVNPRVSYALGSSMPLIANLQRWFGGRLGGKENYQDRQLQSILNALGVPLKSPEPYERGELIGRQFKIGDLVQDLARRGLIPKEK